MRKIIGIAWFETIGIVITYNELTKEKRAYIAPGKGIDPVYDMEFIAYWGLKFPLEAAEIVIKEKGEIKNHILKVNRTIELEP